LYRLLAQRPDDTLAIALTGSDPRCATVRPERRAALAALQAWARGSGRTALATHCDAVAALSRTGHAATLSGPTGERNVYTLVPRESVLCLCDDASDRLMQLAAVLAVGGTAVWQADPTGLALLAALPGEVQACVACAHDWRADTVSFDAVLYHGDPGAVCGIARALAERRGPIVTLRTHARGETAIALEGLVVERALSVNTAAAGGNATLMTIG
jgi:RHH-type proline utilization regulon transcriptional repressor/proline dehydrogenase/delta 1-pyrroline-5-carboxylate dehydrogenase